MSWVKQFEDQDYGLVSDWWKAAGNPCVALSQLQTKGFIGYTDDNEPACAVWAYMSKGVGVAFLEHLVTNPDVKSPMAKMRAVDQMMERMLDELCMDGYQMIRGCTWSPTLAKICKRRWGFEIIGTDYTNMSLMLWR